MTKNWLLNQIQLISPPTSCFPCLLVVDECDKLRLRGCGAIRHLWLGPLAVEEMVAVYSVALEVLNIATALTWKIRDLGWRARSVSVFLGGVLEKTLLLQTLPLHLHLFTPPCLLSFRKIHQHQQFHDYDSLLRYAMHFSSLLSQCCSLIQDCRLWWSTPSIVHLRVY